jgi:hypothetical protein
MAEYRINLIRGRVPSPAQRQGLFWAMVAYVLICGVALVIVAHRGVRDSAAAASRRAGVEAREGQVRAAEGIRGELPAFARELGGEIEQNAKTLDAIRDTLSQRVQVAPLLFGVLGHAAATGARMTRLDIDGTQRRMLFDLAVSEKAAENVAWSQDLIARCKQDPALAPLLSDIKPVGERRGALDGQPAVVYEFACALAKPKG